MPTGYTSKLHDGTPESLPEFLAHLSRGMGLYVMMRDDGPEADLVVDKEVGHWYYESLDDDIKRYQEVSTMSDDAIKNAWHEARVKDAEYRAETKAKNDALRERYEKRLDEIDDLDWPEGEFFDGLRKFATEQIESSIRHDCNYDPTPLEESYPGGADQYHEVQVDAALRSLQLSAERLGKEIKRVRERKEIHETFIKWLGKLEDPEALEW